MQTPDEDQGFPSASETESTYTSNGQVIIYDTDGKQYVYND